MSGNSALLSKSLIAEELKSEKSVRMSEFSDKSDKQWKSAPKKSSGLVKEPYGSGVRVMQNWIKPNFNRVIVNYAGDLEKEPKNEYTHEPMANSDLIESELLLLPNTTL